MQEKLASLGEASFVEDKEGVNFKNFHVAGDGGVPFRPPDLPAETAGAVCEDLRFKRALKDGGQPDSAARGSGPVHDGVGCADGQACDRGCGVFEYPEPDPMTAALDMLCEILIGLPFGRRGTMPRFGWSLPCALPGQTPRHFPALFCRTTPIRCFACRMQQ